MKHQIRQQINSVDKHMYLTESFKQFEWFGSAKIPQGKTTLLIWNLTLEKC